ncbi:MAG TPA: SCO family protein [Pyrinomonadaceae bacterium]|nr:SCO family protein [Pyrinomonadaceae bacterium]
MKRMNVKLLLLGVLMVSIALAINSQAPTPFNFVSYAQEQSIEYSCPMHPEVKSKQAGSCPKCGMHLKQAAKPDAAAVKTDSQDAQWGGSHFPNVELITQHGKKVRFYDDLIKGKVVALELIYTTCKYNCPLETARLVQLQKLLGDRMGKDIFFYSITIEPEHDTPEVLKAYADKYHVGPGWLFLTGKPDDIKLISKKLGLDKLPNGNDPDGHTPSLLIGNEATGIWMRNSALDNTKFMALKIQQLVGYGSQANDVTATNKTESVKLEIDKGKYLFATRCAACHTIGNGDKVGPDLLGVTSVRDRKWLNRMIVEPDKLIEEKDPIATMLFQKYREIRMPRLNLPQEDVNTLIEFMKTQTASFANREKTGTQN